MNLLKALLENLFGKEQCGGETMAVTISMVSPTHCSHISRVSTCGSDTTYIAFNPPIPVAEALLQAEKYTEKGHFTHT